MKKALLVLGLLVMVGCEPYVSETELADKACKQERLPMLQDGRIHIGMTQREFARLWERPPEINIDRSMSRYGTTEWWKFDRNCRACSYHYAHYHFCFENGILDYWSEN